MQALTWTDDQLDEVSRRIESGFAETNARFDQIDLKLEQTDRRLDRIDAKLEQADRRFDRIDAKLEQTDRRLDQIDLRLERVDIRFEGIDQRLDDIDSIKARLDSLDASFRQLAMTQLWVAWGVVAALIGLVAAIALNGAG
jgi:chromosome segregation ATPase